MLPGFDWTGFRNNETGSFSDKQRDTVDIGTESFPVNTGGWRHVIVEVDRHRQGKITFYIDGKFDSSTEIGLPSAEASLSNQGAFLVGKSPAGLLKGRLDFLRLSKATLADAETDIRELYEWEFNDPHLYDFTGSAPTGKSRDAGAVELR